jgi:hypothetical protein
LIDTPVAWVAGATEVTTGATGGGIVVNRHTYGAASGMPVARLVAPLTVAVYSVSGASVVVGINVNVATVPAEFRLTDPRTPAHGLAQVSVKLAAPEIAAIG